MSDVREPSDETQRAIVSFVRDLIRVPPNAWTAGVAHAEHLEGERNLDLEFSTDGYHRSVLRVIAVDRGGQAVLLARRFDGAGNEAYQAATEWEAEEHARSRRIE